MSATSGFRVFADAVAAGGIVKGICVKGGDDLSRSDIEGQLTEVARGARARGLAYLWKRADGWQGGIAKFFSADELEAIGAATGAETGDCVLMVADRPSVVNAALGAVRNHLGRVRRLYDDERIDMLWVTEFPMFERSDETGEISAAHHPFTMIHADDLDCSSRIRSPCARAPTTSSSTAARSAAAASASPTRPSSSACSPRWASTPMRRSRKFGFLLEAFEYGVPPHGGWAGGIDRMVMEGLGTDNIRDVIAFPRTSRRRSR